MDKHFDVSADEDVWDDEDAVEAAPLLFWDFDAVFH